MSRSEWVATVQVVEAAGETGRADSRYRQGPPLGVVTAVLLTGSDIFLMTGSSCLLDADCYLKHIIKLPFGLLLEGIICSKEVVLA